MNKMKICKALLKATIFCFVSYSSFSQVTFFIDDRAGFASNINGVLINEDFENFNTSLICGTPVLNDLSNNNCYTPGSLKSGFSIVQPQNVALSAPGNGGTTSTIIGEIGGNSGDNKNLRIEFTDSPNFFGFDIFEWNLNQTNEMYNINVYSSGLLIGSRLVTVSKGANMFPDAQGNFVGGVTNLKIDSVIIVDAVSGATQMIDNLSFGKTSLAVPTISQWGLIIMALLFLIIGIVALPSVVLKRH